MSIVKFFCGNCPEQSSHSRLHIGQYFAPRLLIFGNNIFFVFLIFFFQVYLNTLQIQMWIVV